MQDYEKAAQTNLDSNTFRIQRSYTDQLIYLFPLLYIYPSILKGNRTETDQWKGLRPTNEGVTRTHAQTPRSMHTQTYRQCKNKTSILITKCDCNSHTVYIIKITIWKYLSGGSDLEVDLFKTKLLACVQSLLISLCSSLP